MLIGENLSKCHRAHHKLIWAVLESNPVLCGEMTGFLLFISIHLRIYPFLFLHYFLLRSISIILCIPIWTKKYRYCQHHNYISHRQGVLNQMMYSYLKTVFVVYWTTLLDYDSIEWQWIPNWNGHRRQRSWPNLRYYPGDCVRRKPGTRTVKIVIVSAGIRTGHLPHNLHYNVKARGALRSLRRT
jgi:hypothetical protein